MDTEQPSRYGNSVFDNQASSKILDTGASHISRVSLANKRARAKVHLLTTLKRMQKSDDDDYKKQLAYFKQVSLYSANYEEAVVAKKKSAISLAKSYRDRASKLREATSMSKLSRATSYFKKEKLSSKYPRLM